MVRVASLPTYVNVCRYADDVKNVNEALFPAIFLPFGHQPSPADSDSARSRVDREFSRHSPADRRKEVDAIRPV